MMQLRLRSKRLGGHIHMDVFVGDRQLAHAGTLVMHEDEYHAFRNTLAQGADTHKLVEFSEECDLREWKAI